MTGGVKVTVWRSKPTPQKATATLHTLRFFRYDDGKEKKKVILSVSSAVCVCERRVRQRQRAEGESERRCDGGGDGEENCRNVEKVKKKYKHQYSVITTVTSDKQ